MIVRKEGKKWTSEEAEQNTAPETQDSSLSSDGKKHTSRVDSPSSHFFVPYLDCIDWWIHADSKNQTVVVRALRSSRSSSAHHDGTNRERIWLIHMKQTRELTCVGRMTRILNHLFFWYWSSELLMFVSFNFQHHKSSPVMDQTHNPFVLLPIAEHNIYVRSGRMEDEAENWRCTWRGNHILKSWIHIMRDLIEVGHLWFPYSHMKTYFSTIPTTRYVCDHSRTCYHHKFHVMGMWKRFERGSVIKLR